MKSSKAINRWVIMKMRRRLIWLKCMTNRVKSLKDRMRSWTTQIRWSKTFIISTSFKGRWRNSFRNTNSKAFPESRAKKLSWRNAKEKEKMKTRWQTSLKLLLNPLTSSNPASLRFQTCICQSRCRETQTSTRLNLRRRERCLSLDQS